LLAGALAFSPSLALADNSDSKPVSKMETDEAKAAGDAANAKWDAMTPEQQAAARKAVRAKRLQCAGQPFTHPDCTPMMGDWWAPPRPARQQQ